METISITIPKDKEVMAAVADWLLREAHGEGVMSIIIREGSSRPYTPEEEATFVPLLDVDTDGRPWDERIDSGSKSKNADGRWKRRKGVDEALVKAVLAEHAAPPVETPAPPVETPAPVTTYSELITFLAPVMQAGKVQPIDIEMACKNCGAFEMAGVDNLPKLANKPEYIPLVAAELRKIWAARK